MKAGAVEIYADHGFLILGSSREFPLALLDGDQPIRASDSHLVLVVRAQIALVRVEFWADVGARAGTIVHRGSLDLPDGRFCVKDVDGISRYSRLFGSPGPHEITLAVDEPGLAPRVYVIENAAEIDPNERLEWDPTMGSVAPLVDPAYDRSGGLEYYLSEHDSAVSRLSAAIDIILPDNGASEVRLRYDLQRLEEWLRWLGPQVGLEDCVAAVEQIRRFLARTSNPDVLSRDELARSIIRNVLPPERR